MVRSSLRALRVLVACALLAFCLAPSVAAVETASPNVVVVERDETTGSEQHVVSSPSAVRSEPSFAQRSPQRDHAAHAMTAMAAPRDGRHLYLAHQSLLI